MNIIPNQPKAEYEALPTGAADHVASTMAVFLDVKNRKVKIGRTRIRDMAKGFAEIAFSMGETNDIEEYTDEMTDNIFKALQQVQKNQKSKKKRSS